LPEKASLTRQNAAFYNTFAPTKKLERVFKNIAIVGNPNSGKSSLFNALTGLNQRVGNFPGVTVDKKTGRCKLPSGETVNMVDLPALTVYTPKVPMKPSPSMYYSTTTKP